MVVVVELVEGGGWVGCGRVGGRRGLGWLWVELVGGGGWVGCRGLGWL